MTDPTRPPHQPPTPLPESFATELRAANAHCINAVDGPNGSMIEFWATARGLMLIQRRPRGHGFDIYCSLDDTNTMSGLLDALRAYLAPRP